MEANQNKKYLFQVKHFTHVNPEWKLSHSGEMSHLDDMSHSTVWKLSKYWISVFSPNTGKYGPEKDFLFGYCSRSAHMNSHFV